MGNEFGSIIPRSWQWAPELPYQIILLDWLDREVPHHATLPAYTVSQLSCWRNRDVRRYVENDRTRYDELVTEAIYGSPGAKV